MSVGVMNECKRSERAAVMSELCNLNSKSCSKCSKLSFFSGWLLHYVCSISRVDPAARINPQKRQNFIFLTVQLSMFLLLQRCAYTLVWFRHKIPSLGFRKQNISHLNICFGPEDSIKTPSFAATNTAEYACISNGFTIKNVKTQTRTVVTGLASSSPVTHMFCDRDKCNTLSINVIVLPRVPFCSAEFKHVQVF